MWKIKKIVCVLLLSIIFVTSYCADKEVATTASAIAKSSVTALFTDDQLKYIFEESIVIIEKFGISFFILVLCTILFFLVLRKSYLKSADSSEKLKDSNDDLDKKIGEYLTMSKENSDTLGKIRIVTSKLIEKTEQLVEESQKNTKALNNTNSDIKDMTTGTSYEFIQTKAQLKDLIDELELNIKDHYIKNSEKMGDLIATVKDLYGGNSTLFTTIKEELSLKNTTFEATLASIKEIMQNHKEDSHNDFERIISLFTKLHQETQNNRRE